MDKIVDIMSKKYDVQRKVLRDADFGDESNRERLLIVGVHNRLQAPTGIFEFLEPMLGRSRTRMCQGDIGSAFMALSLEIAHTSIHQGHLISLPS